jgi:hypothetical protein
VLSDPAKRAKHDEWIAVQMGTSPSFSTGRTRENIRPQNHSSSPRQSERVQNPLTALILRITFFAAAMWLIRTPGLRLVGVLMLLAGWGFLQARPR